MEPPPSSFATTYPLSIIAEDPKNLVRVSGYSSGEPYFGKKAANRFDDPRVRVSNRFGTCYFGRDIVVAVAETILHDEVAINGRFKIALDELSRRHVVTFSGATLRLADCTGVALKQMGLDGSFSTVRPYNITQQWALAIHKHVSNVDGLVYVSRHINTASAVVLFERAGSKLRAPKYQPLVGHAGAVAALGMLGVDFV